MTSILDLRSKLIFIEFCYQMAFDVQDSKKKIDDIRACFYKFYNEYADATRVQMQSSIGSSELAAGFDGQKDINLVSTFNLSKIKFGMDFVQFRNQSSSKRPKRSDLDSYLDDDVLFDLRDKQFDILAW